MITYASLRAFGDSGIIKQVVDRCRAALQTSGASIDMAQVARQTIALVEADLGGTDRSLGTAYILQMFNDLDATDKAAVTAALLGER